MTTDSFLRLTAGSPHPAFLLAEDGRVAAANPMGARILGCSVRCGDEQVDFGGFVDGPGDRFAADLRAWTAASLPTSRIIRLRGPDGRSIRYRAEGVRVTNPGTNGRAVLILLHLEPVDPPLPATAAGTEPQAVPRVPSAPTQPSSGPGPSSGSAPARLEPPSTAIGKMQALGDFSAGISHDFNNLLTVMKVEIELAMEHDDLPAGVVDSLLATHAAILRAESIVRALLAFSRAQIGETSVVDLRALLEQALPRFRAITGSTRLFLEPSPDPLPVEVDRPQIETVIAALVRNAVEASEDGTAVRIRTRRQTIDRDFARAHPGSTEGVHAVLDVEDEGMGISEDVAARMFEPFYTTKGRGYGRGLGLAQAYGIVKAAGGYLGVQTQPGRGSTLSVYLPLHTSG